MGGEKSVRQFRGFWGVDFSKIFKYSLGAKARKIRLDMPLAVHLKDAGLERKTALV